MDLFKKDQEVGIWEHNQVIVGTVINPDEGENKMTVEFPSVGETVVDKDDVVQIDGFQRKKPTYFQPRLKDEEFILNGIGSFEVYRYFKHAKEDYPDHIIDVFEGSDIEDHTYIDDEDGRSLRYYVDVPNYLTDADDFTNVYQCFDRDEAILYARLTYGADEHGMVSIISQS